MAKRTGGFIGQDGINAPDPATGVTGTAGDGQVTVSWTNPSDVGGAAINGYAISSNPSVPIALPSLATASYTSKSFSLASQGSGDIFFGMTFNSDGTKAYFTGYGAASIFQYSLSTAWDISTTSYDNVTLSTSGQTSSGQSGLVFSPDGTKLYMVSYNTDTVYQYTLTTPFDLSSGSYANKSLSVSSQDSNPQDMYIKSDGTKLYVLGDTNNSVFQYSMSTPFDLATASYDSVSFATTSQQTNPTGLFFSPDGTTILICGYAPKSADKYTLSTPWVVSSASHVKSYTLTELSSGYPNSIFAGNDLSNMFVAGGNASNTDGSIFQYNVGMPTGSPFVYGGLTNGTSYTFNVWAINPFGWSSPSDASGGVSPAAPRALFAGGNTSSDTIDYVEIGTTGNATDFGNLLNGQQAGAAFGSSTRSIFYTGTSGTFEFVNPFSAGNATDFGDPTVVRGAAGGASNSTRGLLCCGESGGTYTNIIDYVTISTAGNATDFGDMQFGATAVCATSSPTRMVAGGGFYYSGGFNYINYAGFVTIASTGNSSTFGNLTASSRIFIASASSNTRGLFAGGGDVYNNTVNTIEYITTASTGDFTDFGDMSFSGSSRAGTSNNIRAVFGGGRLAGGATPTNIIDYVSIATTGNATDFGDLTAARYEPYATSSAHGGLS